MPKLQKIKNQYFITLPKTLVEQKGWVKKQALFFIFNERGNIEITESLANGQTTKA